MATAATKPAAIDNLRAALWMLVAILCFSAIIIIVRYLNQTHHPYEIAFFRNFFGLCAMLPFLYRNGLQVLRTERLPLHCVRAGLALVAMLTWFTALGLMPLAEATALSFTAPIFISILAVWFFGERIRLRRGTAIAIAFLGVLVILRPGAGVMEPVALLALASAITIAFSTMTVKKLGQTEASPVIVTYMVLILTPITAALAASVWVTPNLPEFIAFLALGGVGSFGHFCLSQSLNIGEASFLAPLDYLRLPLVALFAYMLFGETVDNATWIGAAIIIASTLYIAQREAALKAKRTHPAASTNTIQ